MSVVWLNGRLMAEEDARVPVTDRGLLIGDGIFETARAYAGRVFRLDAHLRRMSLTAKRIGIPMPDRLSDAVYETLSANDLVEGAVRITLTRGSGMPGLLASDDPEPTVLVTARPYQPRQSWYQDGITVIIAGGRRNEHAVTAGMKHLGYLDGVIAQAEAVTAGADDALYRDVAGHVVEGPTSNLFMVSDGVVYTPPVTCGILEGITRGAVLDIVAAAKDLVFSQEPIWPDQLLEAQEAFLTGSLRELVPIIALDRKPIGDGRPGPVFRRLLEAYRELVRAEVGVSP